MNITKRLRRNAAFIRPVFRELVTYGVSYELAGHLIFIYFSSSFYFPPRSLARWRANENNYVTRPNQWPQPRRPAGRSFVRPSVRSFVSAVAVLRDGVSVGRKRDPAERAASGAEPARTRSHHLGYRVAVVTVAADDHADTQLVDRPVPIPTFMQTSLAFASRFKKKKKN